VLEKQIKQVCKCEKCGNESEMVITCSLEEEELQTPAKAPIVAPVEKARAKGHGVCTHCGNEADMWVDIEQ
jgi:hypothetical protein